MNVTKRRMVVLAATGAVGLGVVAVAVPAVAGVGPLGAVRAAAVSQGPGDGSGNGNRNGNGMGMGMGMGMDADDGPGMSGRGPYAGGNGAGCLVGDLAAMGTLTAEQQSTLVAMAQEEKLAHDLYVAFSDRYDAVIFDRIAMSETQHLTVVRMLLDRYGLADPTAGVAGGQFGDPAVQATYDRLLAEGRSDVAAALRVGQTVEQTDIDDLRAAQNGLTAPDVTQVYANLLEASQRHLTAFQRWS
jgi:hypothetical protein